MHYNRAGLDARQIDFYRGYTTAQKLEEWQANYELHAQTALNAQRGALNTVQAELRPADDETMDHIEGLMLNKTENAWGNKDLAQLTNYHNTLLVTEPRRQRRMLGALTQALVIQHEHQTNLNAWTQAATDHFYLESNFQVRRYTGAGGIRTVSLD